uniref:Uncharacterized protein n=1 Tax=mine drainage metagenome TaxID=410659 RepID=E6QXE2_9ZZZZ
MLGAVCLLGVPHADNMNMQGDKIAAATKRRLLNSLSFFDFQ